MSALSQPETAHLAGRQALRPSPISRSVLLSLNPRAGSGAGHDRVANIVEALESCHFQVRLVTDLEVLKSTAEEAQKAQDLRCVLAVGGDGTACAVRRSVPLDIPMVIVPMGTENLLGRYLNQVTDPVALVDLVENGLVVELDLGRANGDVFLLMISVGFDAEVIRGLHENRRGNISRAAYFLPTLRALRSYRYPPIRIYWDNAAAEPTLCRWIFGFNLPLYALGLPIAPDAIGTDGLLDVCTFERGTMFSIARYLWHILRGVHLNLPDAGLRQAKQFRLESTSDAATAYQLDGDFAGVLPVEIEIFPKQLKLLVTSETAERLGFLMPEVPSRV
ncbi:MAG TPA: diacylglycerol kinase family protein [Lacipirellulaceae bacterium]|nr:diacylglycerol kinase family protein [Lacipirellulaceae bacterium]